MTTVSEILTNYNSGNHHGRLHLTTPDDTPFYTLAGGFADGGGKVLIAEADEFGWQVSDRRDPSATKQKIDAADAPTAENRARTKVTNVIETHTETVGAGFERMAQRQQMYVPGNSSLDGLAVGGQRSPVTDELAFQVGEMWKTIKTDEEKSLTIGTYHRSTDNVTASRTKSITEAIATNVVSGRELAQSCTADATTDAITCTGHGFANNDTVYFGGTTAPGGLTAGTAYFVRDADANTFKVAATEGGAAINITSTGTAVTVARGKELDDYLVEYAGQLAYDNGGLMEGDTRFLMLPSIHKMQLTAAFRRQGLQVRSRNQFGVNVTEVDNSFGRFNVVLNRWLPKGTALELSFEQICLWHRLVPQHEDVPGGVSFAYKKARTGNRTEMVLYTSVGLEYGNEKAHAKIVDLSHTRPVAA